MWNTSRMAKNFRELEAKMSPESRARAQALAEKYRAEMAQVSPQVAELLEKALALSTQDRGLLIDGLVASLDNKPADPADIARWFEKLDEFGPEPFGDEKEPPPTPMRLENQTLTTPAVVVPTLSQRARKDGAPGGPEHWC